VRKRAIGAEEQTDAQPGVMICRWFSPARSSRAAGAWPGHGHRLRSRIGQIGQSLATLETEAPRLQKETSRVVTLCAIGGLAIAALVVLLYGCCADHG
jgi:Ca2+-transporting ATPase